MHLTIIKMINCALSIIGDDQHNLSLPLIKGWPSIQASVHQLNIQYLITHPFREQIPMVIPKFPEIHTC